ncbi:hypothetical protein ACT009_10830 [Sphingomonas sp. Tas61C01]|uniref:hypothetical protein n=1 Tax=Sphingomonas sp. Tas61C01 TaxID=3458297 RepID=UPI00403E7916
MTISHEQRLRDLARALGLAWHEGSFGSFEGERREEYARMIVASQILADESRRSLGLWIDASRRAGMSWVDIGALLGISKQAAQQRFGGQRDDAEPPAEAIVVKLGTTPLTEAQILAQQGAAGRELIEIGTFRLVFRASGTAWDYLRSVRPLTADRLENEGWQAAGRWFVFHYYKRQAGG